MSKRKNIFVIIGSASRQSANEKLVDYIAGLTRDEFDMKLCSDLKTLPHFDPELSTDNPPKEVISLRQHIENAEGIIICTPEYVFSIPSGLKNAIEWCVSTTVFSDKPTGLITASANGQKGHEELQLIMKTVMAKFVEGTTLLIPGIKGKMNEQGQMTDETTKEELAKFVKAFKDLLQ